MGCLTKIQLIKRKSSEQWYVNFPAPIAHALEFSRGESFEWIIEDKSLLALRRLNPPTPTLKKTTVASSTTSSISGNKAGPASPNPASPTSPNPSCSAPCSASDDTP